MARARLSREIILDAAAHLVRTTSGEITLAQLGTQLGVDATAFYRHFRDKDELMRATADQILSAVTVDLPAPTSDWRTTVALIMTRLRVAHLTNPRLAELVRSGPPLNANEFDLTDRVLAELRAAGCTPRYAALAYHALIELTVGAAALDAALAATTPAERRASYDHWRQTYRDLDPARYPTATRLADRLYQGDADSRFAFALDRMLDGIAAGIG